MYLRFYVLSSCNYCPGGTGVTAELHVSSGATYLQSSRAEAECIAYMTAHLGRENSFRTLKFATEVAASSGMRSAAQAYIERTFSPVLAIFSRSEGGGNSSPLQEFLTVSGDRWREVLSADIQVCEDLLFYALLGWIEHNVDTRRV